LQQVGEPYNSESDSDRNIANLYLDNDEHPQDFEGDLYGNDYQELDFPGFDGTFHLPADGSDDEDDAMGDGEDGWEPEPLDQPAGGRDIPPPVIINPVPSNRHESHNRLSQQPIVWLFNDHPIVTQVLC